MTARNFAVLVAALVLGGCELVYDADKLKPDATESKSDGGASGLDAAAVDSDAATPGLDAAADLDAGELDAAAVAGLDAAAAPGLDAAVAGLDAAAPVGLDATTSPGLDAAAPAGLDAALPPGLDAAAPAGLDAAAPAGLDAAAPAGLDAAAPAGLDAAAPAGLDAAGPAGLDAAAPAGFDAAAPAGLDAAVALRPDAGSTVVSGDGGCWIEEALPGGLSRAIGVFVDGSGNAWLAIADGRVLVKQQAASSWTVLTPPEDGGLSMTSVGIFVGQGTAYVGGSACCDGEGYSLGWLAECEATTPSCVWDPSAVDPLIAIGGSAAALHYVTQPFDANDQHWRRAFSDQSLSYEDLAAMDVFSLWASTDDYPQAVAGDHFLELHPGPGNWSMPPETCAGASGRAYLYSVSGGRTGSTIVAVGAQPPDGGTIASAGAIFTTSITNQQCALTSFELLPVLRAAAAPADVDGDFWLVGDAETIIHGDGQAWQLITPPAGKFDLEAAWTSATEVWVAGNLYGQFTPVAFHASRACLNE